MRAFELFNKLTLGNKLFVTGLAMSLSATTASAQELVSSVLPTEQFEANRCDASTSNWRTEQKDFAQACATAELGNATSCEKKLESCAAKNNKPSYCIGKAISRADNREEQREARDEQNELEDRKNTLLQSFRDKQNEILDAKEAQASIAQQIQQVGVNNANARVQRQMELEAALQNIVNTIANLRDQEAQAELKLSEVVLNNEMECREKALSEKNRYIQLVRNRKLTAKQVFGRAGLSVNESGSIRYEKVLSNCTALYTNTGRRTGFGSQYKIQEKALQLTKDNLSRQIDAQLIARRAVIKNTTLAIAQLDQQSSAELIRLHNANAAATHRLTVLQFESQDMLAQYQKLEGEITILGKTITASQVTTISKLAAASLSDKDSETESTVKVARQEKIDAFNKAVSLLEVSKNAEEDRAEVCGLQNDAADLARASDSINFTPIATTATATPIDGSARTPASGDLPTAGQTL